MPKEISELVDALKELCNSICGHCDARYCEADLHPGDERVPCVDVRKAQALIEKYAPKEENATEKNDDGLPF